MFQEVMVSVKKGALSYDFMVEVVVSSASEWEPQGIYLLVGKDSVPVDDILDWEMIDAVYEQVAIVIEQGELETRFDTKGERLI